jgi:hypothetical protein
VKLKNTPTDAEVAAQINEFAEADPSPSLMNPFIFSS